KNWEVFQEPLSASIPLATDGYFELHSEEAIYSTFLEVDPATQGQRLCKNKTAVYLRLELAGESTRPLSQERFSVLVAATAERRRCLFRMWFPRFDHAASGDSSLASHHACTPVIPARHHSPPDIRDLPCGRYESHRHCRSRAPVFLHVGGSGIGTRMAAVYRT